MHHPTEASLLASQDIQKQSSVVVRAVNLLPPVTAGGQVREGTGEFQATGLSKPWARPVPSAKEVTSLIDRCDSLRE
jgi:hypothetical protein